MSEDCKPEIKETGELINEAPYDMRSEIEARMAAGIYRENKEDCLKQIFHKTKEIELEILRKHDIRRMAFWQKLKWLFKGGRFK